MELQEVIERLDKRFDKIEENQEKHSSETRAEMAKIHKTCTTLVTKQEQTEETQKDHEARLRKNESILTKVTAFFTLMSGAFGTALAWALDKIISGGGQ